MTDETFVKQYVQKTEKKLFPAAAGEVNRETRYALDFFGMEPPDGMKKARVVGIVDHHGIGDVRNTRRIAVLSLPVAATGSIIFKLYRDCDVEILPSVSAT